VPRLRQRKGAHWAPPIPRTPTGRLVALVLLVLGAAAGTGLVLTGVLGTARTPGDPLGHVGSAAGAAAALPAAAGPELLAADYRPGDCVSWPQDGSGGAVVQSAQVPCAGPHLIEIVQLVVLSDLTGAYPGPDRWAQLVDQRCTPLAETYLGRRLDPLGRFRASAILPASGAWAQGDRRLWCGIGAVPATPAGTASAPLPEFSGAVKGQDQARVDPVGTCLPATGAGSFGPPVSCAASHAVEITGTVTLEGARAEPQTADQWRAAAGPACDASAAAYVGGTLSGGYAAGWLAIDPISWSLGRRVVECTVGRYDGAGQLVPASRSVRVTGRPSTAGASATTVVTAGSPTGGTAGAG